MKKYIITFTFVLIASFGFSQIAAQVGTYQLMTTNVKMKEVFTSDILTTIEANRKVNTVSVIKVGDVTWVRILSLNTITSPNFIPLPEGIIEVDPDDSFLNNAIKSNN